MNLYSFRFFQVITSGSWWISWTCLSNAKITFWRSTLWFKNNNNNNNSRNWKYPYITRTSYVFIDKISSILFLFKSGPSAQLEDILNTVDRLQQFRLDDQRTNLPSSSTQDSNNNTNATNRRLSPLNEQFFDQLSKCQVRRIVFLFH